MAINKLINDLESIKQATNDLRINLINGGVPNISNTATLPSLVSRVPEMSFGLPISNEDWQPDPLWVFPDPNGSDDLKNIRQIYQEDTTKDSYTYSGIFLIYGMTPTINLKDSETATTTSLTFKTSDGAIYTNVTATSLIHTWDMEKDVIDSFGRVVRYVLVYSNTALGTSSCPRFERTTLWAINNLVVEMFPSPTTFTNCLYARSILEAFESDTLQELRATTSSNTIGIFESSCLKYFRAPNLQYIGLTGTNAYTGYPFNGTLLNVLNLENLKSVRCNEGLFGYSASIYNTSATPTKVILSNLKTISNTTSFFYGMMRVKYLDISSLESSSSVLFHSSNYGAFMLTDIKVKKDFDIDGFNLSICTYLKKSSILDFFENLKDLTGQTAKTITIGAVNLSKLTPEEIAIATNKNWTVS